ncbi:MAG: DUF1501 domain-containing protein [Parashewanella sp.]
MKRRQFIKILGSSIVLMQSPKLVFARSNTILDTSQPKRNFVWIILRGALDSMHTIIPEFDSEYKQLRPNLSKQIKLPTLPIDNGFALHPALTNLHQWYQQGQFAPIVAVSTGYNSRSHFDGQDYLESGSGTQNVKTGWLARALDQKNSSAISITNSTPITLRGSDKVNTWFPSNFKSANADVFAKLETMYEEHPTLLENLHHGLALKRKAQNIKSNKGNRNFATLTHACGKLLIASPNMDCAMLEMTGWDTHNAQSSRLERQLSELDKGLQALKGSLAEQWSNTVVAIATEFGRTAKENGTGGTDHGTGSALFLAGGAINGGKVLGKWPGLQHDQLFQQRDLQPTSNTFDWLATVLSQHWQLSSKQIAASFPHATLYSEKLVV